MQKTESPRGILKPDLSVGEIFHARFHAPPLLDPFIEHFWTVRWNLAGLPPREVETLPYPSVQLTFEGGKAWVHGVSKKKFIRTIEGDNFVFGAKFRPGGFYPFYRKPLNTVLDKVIPAEKIFGKEIESLRDKIFACSHVDEMQTATIAFLENIVPPPDENSTLINTLLQSIIDDRSVTRAEQIAARCGKNLRQLQRLFSTYVGLSPKWIIGRYRIHEAIERVRNGETHNWAGLAADLGYADQAHFIRDFKALTGKTPGEFSAAEKKS